MCATLTHHLDSGGWEAPPAVQRAWQASLTWLLAPLHPNSAVAGPDEPEHACTAQRIVNLRQSHQQGIQVGPVQGLAQHRSRHDGLQLTVSILRGQLCVQLAHRHTRL